jgi:hypothetical protein
MHRSGTSFTANLAQKAGLDLGPPERLILPDKWNPKGYYENIDIVNLNNQIIVGDFIRKQYWLIPSHQRAPIQQLLLSAYKAFYLMFPSQRLFAARARKKKRDIRNLSAKYRNIAVKDPRFSLVFAYWHQYSRIDKILYCYRHPHEAANSLKKRERIPLWLGYKVWLYHINTFLDQISITMPTISFINFNHFFFKETRMDEVKRIYNFLNRPYDDTEANNLISHVLDRSLKNHAYQTQCLPVHVKGIYERLNRYHEKHQTPIPFEP